MRKKVVIIGHGFTSRLCVIRSVAKLDCDITVIVMTGIGKDGKAKKIGKPVDCYSKYVSRILYCQSEEHALIDMLLGQCTDENQKAILFPDSDFSAAAIDNHQDQLSEHFLFPHINHEQGAVVRWMNKEKQKELAQKVEMNVANSVSFDIKDGKFTLPKDIHYPCFTKTRAYMVGTKQTLKRCDNEQELLGFVQQLSSQYDLTLLVEDYKEIEKEYAVLGFSDGKIVDIPGVLQILTMAHGNHTGVACKGMVMPTTEFEPLIEQMKEFVLQVGYVGVFDIDFYQSGGVLYFGELNLRIGGSCYAVTKTGSNLPAMMVRHLCGESVDDLRKNVMSSATYINERMCLDDWRTGYLSFAAYRRLLSSADISFVKDDDDPKPYKVFRRRHIPLIAKKTVKSLIGKK